MINDEIRAKAIIGKYLKYKNVDPLEEEFLMKAIKEGLSEIREVEKQEDFEQELYVKKLEHYLMEGD